MERAILTGCGREDANEEIWTGEDMVEDQS